MKIGTCFIRLMFLISVFCAFSGSKAWADQVVKVQSGDTLQKISMKLYNSTRHWREILEANKESIKDPDRISPGLILSVPSGVRSSPSLVLKNSPVKLKEYPSIEPETTPQARGVVDRKTAAQDLAFEIKKSQKSDAPTASGAELWPIRTLELE
jgi:nucleoid-associated protein YgaU